MANSVIQRLVETSREPGAPTYRIREILSMPMRARHITNFVKGDRFVDGIPLFDAQVLWQIKRAGLRVSKAGQGAIYGDGAYCLARGTPPPSTAHFYIDVEIPTAVGVEQISIPGIEVNYYRFLPEHGDHITGVKIIDTNLPMHALQAARDFMNG